MQLTLPAGKQQHVGGTTTAEALSPTKTTLVEGQCRCVMIELLTPT